mmetsp:Transcript_4193/g.13449  ORF Transcript_4193/g.13449 Transcript_4193/m.13449 type:complete len:83 (+) Transcript_4193:1848-2096(+)
MPFPSLHHAPHDLYDSVGQKAHSRQFSLSQWDWKWCGLHQLAQILPAVEPVPLTGVVSKLTGLGALFILRHISQPPHALGSF